MNKQPKINVGIVAQKKLDFSCGNDFKIDGSSVFLKGEYSAAVVLNKIQIKNKSDDQFLGDSFVLSPTTSDNFFELKEVIIGVDFHWEQKENQQFKGALKLIVEADKVRAINIVDLEDYLKSVISSEMSATSSPELLKAHAVISRSWLLAQIEKSRLLKISKKSYATSYETDQEVIRWYDREDHETFDVCADDHCQRYQGITRIHSKKALQAVEDTFGEILFSDKNICDARFSKCCGGIAESFENVWEPVQHSYLTRIIDNNRPPSGFNTNLNDEENAKSWICNSPEAFCNTSDQQILSQVLPDYDQSTKDFYRWKVEYSQSELSALIKKRSGIDFGKIIKLEPVERGYSGRLIKLKIIGSKRSITLGKELEIRKWLSASHLYSSAFIIDHLNVENNIPEKFILTGAGWGHGVGLCQIGAAVMGENGYSYKEILNHYFKGAELKKRYQ